MRVAIECAGFTPSEADQLRRSMATFKHTGGVSKFRDKLISGMIAHGYEREYAEQTFRQLEGFGSYGFPESHAASFALNRLCLFLAQMAITRMSSAPRFSMRSRWAFTRRPRSSAMRATMAVDIRPVCVNASRFDCTLEPTEEDRFAVRLGLRMVRGFANAHATALSPRERMIPLPRSMISGAAPASQPPPSCNSPRPTPSGIAETRQARGAMGDQGRCATSRCRSSLPHQPARQKPSRNSMSQP